LVIRNDGCKDRSIKREERQSDDHMVAVLITERDRRHFDQLSSVYTGLASTSRPWDSQHVAWNVCCERFVCWNWLLWVRNFILICSEADLNSTAALETQTLVALPGLLHIRRSDTRGCDINPVLHMEPAYIASFYRDDLQFPPILVILPLPRNNSVLYRQRRLLIPKKYASLGLATNVCRRRSKLCSMCPVVPQLREILKRH